LQCSILWQTDDVQPGNPSCSICTPRAQLYNSKSGEGARTCPPAAVPIRSGATECRAQNSFDNLPSYSPGNNRCSWEGGEAYVQTSTQQLANTRAS